MDANPLLNVLNEEFISYAKIMNEHYKPAIEYSILQASESISKFISDLSSFSIASFESAYNLFDQLSSIYSNKIRVDMLKDDNLNAKEINEAINKFKSSLYSNRELFDLFHKIDKAQFDKEEKAAYDVHMRKFLENGMLLESKDSLAKLSVLNIQLSNLIAEYEKNIIKDTETFHLHIVNEDDVKEMPEASLLSAKDKAKEKGYEEGYVFTLQTPSYIPFMMHCPKRELRKQLYFAFNSRCLNTPNSNRKLLKEIIDIRKEKAQLLGFASYNQFILSNRMAKSEEEVISFLKNIQDKALPFAQKEYEALLSFAKTLDQSLTNLEAWDMSYYSERYKKHLFGVDSEMIRKYFPLSKVLSVLFDLVKEMYDITITSVPDEHLYHSDVQVYKMSIQEKTLSYFYIDLYPRKEKKGGGWVYPLKPQIINPIPIVGILANTQRPVGDSEPYMYLGEANTIFHELGHALHISLCKNRYKSICGLNVLWDFVELFSQFMENFLYEKAILTRFNLPSDYIDQIYKMKTYMMGIATQRQINLSRIDLMIHSDSWDSSCDIEEFARKNSVSVVPMPEGVCPFVHFDHLFNATYDYSCGYYSYMWAEVLACDVYEEFKGMKNMKETALRFEKTMLSKGGSEFPMILFEAFKGKPYSIEPFLKERGFI